MTPTTDLGADRDLAACLVPSPLGALRLVASARGLVALTYPEHRGARVLAARGVGPADAHLVLDLARRELEAWLAGRRTGFTVPLDPRGTPFQRAVWDALLAIPFGARTTYGALAAALGRPTATRAVAGANRLNPLSIVVPCHRVVGADGGLTGYAGGLAAKAWLLAHERRVADARAAAGPARRPEFDRGALARSS